MARQKARLAVLFADVSDSTRLYEKMGDTAAFGQVRECLQVLTEATQQYGGWVIKTIGDGLMCAFPSADTAAQAACEMQHRIEERPGIPGKPKITIRIGFHFGSLLREGNDVYGDTVNTAARMSSLAASAQIITTGETASRLSVPLQSQLRRIDALAVKGKEKAVDVQELFWQYTGERTQLPGRGLTLLPEPHLRLVHRGEEIVFHARLALGRDPAADIVLADPMASRTHARIEKRKGNFVLIDQSSNGTYVTVSGRDEIVLRREEFILHGTGVIAFGHALHERPNCEVVEFVCESANDVLRSGFATT